VTCVAQYLTDNISLWMLLDQDLTHSVVRRGESQDYVTGDVGYWLFKDKSLGQYVIGLYGMSHRYDSHPWIMYLKTR
jgi:hypothetical protein